MSQNVVKKTKYPFLHIRFVEHGVPLMSQIVEKRLIENWFLMLVAAFILRISPV